MRRTSTLLGIVAAIGYMSASASAAIHVVTVQDFSFTPSTVNAVIGDTVRWTWVGGFHTVTSGGVPNACLSDETWFDHAIDNTLPANMQFDFVIPANAPPQIPYFCIPHCPIMTGTINVTNSTVPATSTWGLVMMTLGLVTVATVIAIRRGWRRATA